MPPIPVPTMQTDPLGRERQLLAPAGAGQGLVACDRGELGEPVRPPALLAAEEVQRFEVAAGAGAVLEAALARRPAVDQGRCADPERGDRTGPGDHDAATQDAFATTMSTTSPTVFRFWTSSPTSSTPNSSSTI